MNAPTLFDIAASVPRGTLAEAEDLAWRLLEHLILTVPADPDTGGR